MRPRRRCQDIENAILIEESIAGTMRWIIPRPDVPRQKFATMRSSSAQIKMNISQATLSLEKKGEIEGIGGYAHFASNWDGKVSDLVLIARLRCEG